MGRPETPLIVGRYAIHGRIAAGGMAAVHFGRLLGPTGFSRTVAIKRLHAHLAEEPDFLATMVDEAHLAARIHHPNVVPTLDVVAVDRELLVVMEYIRGDSLSRLVRVERDRGRKVPLPVASAIVIGALHGLHAAHETKNDRGEPLGIVHRDVSPQNIVVGVDGQARIIDFGVAKASGRLSTTREGVIKGKLTYMAPEQLSAGATGDVSRRADIYAMGVVLWELLTGTRLFTGKDEAAILGQVLAGVDAPPSRHVADLPRELDELVMRALSDDPADRFATAMEMANALTRIIAPAYSPEVGAWVEEVAHETLAARDALLQELESGSEVRPRALPSIPGETTVSVLSQPSSVSVETSGARGPARSRWPLWGAIGAVVLIVGIAGASALRRAPAPATSPVGSAAGESVSSLPEPSPPDAPPSAAAPPVAPPPSVSATATAAPAKGAPPTRRPARSPTPSPRAPVDPLAP